ncbi:MAG: hypothetical protein ABJM29_12655 [Rhizobiaceae bacterium]
MTIVTASETRQPRSPGQSLRAVIRDIFSIEASDRVSVNEATKEDTTDQMVQLMEKIDNGFTVDETGEHVTLPSYARAYVKTHVKTDGWV